MEIGLDKAQQNKNHLHQLTIKFARFLPINFLPLPRVRAMSLTVK